MSVPLSLQLAHTSADEMVSALGLSGVPSPLRRGFRRAFSFASVPLGRTLARFDARITELGIDRAAAHALADLEADWQKLGHSPPAAGPLLVVSNHPGAYDALVLLAALGRRDVAIVAADRVFLRALPALAPHLLFVADGGSPAGRVSGVRHALAHLRSGGVLLHFGAGEIEPDPAFVTPGSPPLSAAWRRGTGTLVRGAARAGGQVVAAIVDGVHSPRAKRAFVTRFAERRGVTTLAPLLQVALTAYHDVAARVRFGEPLAASSLIAGPVDDATIAERVRSAALELSAR